MFPAAAGVTDAAPLLFLPASSPLNPSSADIVVATAGACAAFAAQAGSPTCSWGMAYSVNGGTYYFLGAAAALGMTAATQCGA